MNKFNAFSYPDCADCKSNDNVTLSGYYTIKELVNNTVPVVHLKCTCGNFLGLKRGILSFIL